MFRCRATLLPVLDSRVISDIWFFYPLLFVPGWVSRLSRLSAITAYVRLHLVNVHSPGTRSLCARWFFSLPLRKRAIIIVALAHPFSYRVTSSRPSNWIRERERFEEGGWIAETMPGNEMGIYTGKKAFHHSRHSTKPFITHVCRTSPIQFVGI